MAANALTGYQRAFFEPLQIEAPDKSVHPSFATVEEFWKLLQSDVDFIERAFARISKRIGILKWMEQRGYVNPDEMDQGKEWYDMRIRALALLFWRAGLLEDTFTDGAGI